MKKLTILFILLIIRTFGQVGINTETPSATLDIVSKGSTSLTKAIEINNSSNIEMMTVLDNGRVGIGTTVPKGALDINSSTLGVAFPRLTATQRDAIAIGSRPPGTVIYNLSISRLEVNTGTDNLPIWIALGEVTSNSSINTSATYVKTVSQVFYNGGGLVNYDTDRFNNTPTGYVTKISQQQFRLASGKSYRIEINSGSVVFSNINSLNCSILSNNFEIGRLRAYPTTFAVNVSGPNNTVGFVDLTTSSNDSDITVRCNTGGGSASLASGTIYDQPYPYITFTILN